MGDGSSHDAFEPKLSRSLDSPDDGMGDGSSHDAFEPKEVETFSKAKLLGR